MRLREYPGQGFVKVVGNLRWKFCKKDPPLIKSSIDAHIKTKKHAKDLQKQGTLDKTDKAFALEITYRLLRGPRG